MVERVLAAALGFVFISAFYWTLAGLVLVSLAMGDCLEHARDHCYDGRPDVRVVLAVEFVLFIAVQTVFLRSVLKRPKTQSAGGGGGMISASSCAFRSFIISGICAKVNSTTRIGTPGKRKSTNWPSVR